MPATKKSRPAEKSSLAAGAFATLIAFVFGIDDPDVLLALPIVVGTVAGAVTWLVERSFPDDAA